MIDRRKFLIAAAAAPFLAKGGRAESRSAPFRVLYSNDTTNITSCVSPYHKAREPFRPRMLEASVDEVSGVVNAHLLQPGLGMVPMWPSKVLPLEEHYAWIKQRYGQEPDSFGRYVLGGGDVVKLFIDRCRLRGQAPFISFRLNDAHHKEYADAAPGEKIGSLGMSVTRSYAEHPEWRLGRDPRRAAEVVQNWAVPEVRAEKLALITELCQNYDLDGLELDFMRYYSFFDLERTTRDERCAIMAGFVRQVRAALDRGAHRGRRRWLGARVPCLVQAFGDLGIDLAQWHEAGLDIINLSASYFTTQQMEIAAIRRLAPGALIFAELCHSIWNGAKLVPGYDTFPFRRTTPEQMWTTAHLARARGADGVSLFNFAYYREHGGQGRGPFGEPPFELLKNLGDAAWLARQPQHFFLAPGWNNPFVRPPVLPRKVDPGRTEAFLLELAPPEGGWKGEGILRLQCEASQEGARWSACMNGIALTATDDVAEPFPCAWPALMGSRATLRGWVTPAGTWRDGRNEVSFTLESGDTAQIVLIDLAMRNPRNKGGRR